MTTIGDSFAVVAILLGIAVTAWAMTMTFGLMFAGKAAQSRDILARSPGKSFLIGLVLTLTLGVVALGLSSSPVPIAKIMGIAGLMGLLSVATIGQAGFTLLAADRIRAMEPSVSPYGAFGRACAIVTTGTFFPILGWFLIGPVLVVTALGVGVQALFSRQAEQVPLVS